METSYIDSINKIFLQYKTLAEKSFSQLSDAEIMIIPAPESNSVALIVKHTHGNMLSRWTDFYTTDGEKEWRKRDDEFENGYTTKTELLKDWEAGWACLFAITNKLTAADLSKIIYIRGEAHLVLDAINRQIAHYSYHVGQIVFLAKLIKQANWNSLSIPKGQSKQFNDKLMGK